MLIVVLEFCRELIFGNVVSFPVERTTKAESCKARCTERSRSNGRSLHYSLVCRRRTVESFSPMLFYNLFRRNRSRFPVFTRKWGEIRNISLEIGPHLYSESPEGYIFDRKLKMAAFSLLFTHLVLAFNLWYASASAKEMKFNRGRFIYLPSGTTRDWLQSVEPLKLGGCASPFRMVQSGALRDEFDLEGATVLECA